MLWHRIPRSISRRILPIEATMLVQDNMEISSSKTGAGEEFRLDLWQSSGCCMVIKKDWRLSDSRQPSSSVSVHYGIIIQPISAAWSDDSLFVKLWIFTVIFGGKAFRSVVLSLVPVSLSHDQREELRRECGFQKHSHLQTQFSELQVWTSRALCHPSNGGYFKKKILRSFQQQMSLVLACQPQMVHKKKLVLIETVSFLFRPWDLFSLISFSFRFMLPLNTDP